MQYYQINFLLFFKWILFNSIILYLVSYFYLKGWITVLLVSDISFITPLIFFLIGAGVVLSGFWAFTISKELLNLKKGKDIIKQILPGNIAKDKRVNESLKLVVSSRLSSIRYIAWSLVVLGLIGTVLGFIIVLLGIDPAVVGNVELVGELIANMTTGLGVALYTTLAGTVGNLWLLVNYNMLQTATIQLYSAIIMDIPDV